MIDKPYWQQRRDLKNGKTDRQDAGIRANKPDQPKSGPTRAKPSDPANKPKKAPQKKIRQASKKRVKELRQYKPVRRKFLQQHPKCEIPVEGCTGVSTEIHHAGGRENGRLLLETDFKAACRNCHGKATKNSREAIAAGHSKSRLGKPNKS